MSELVIVDRQVSAFDTVELDPDGRVNYDHGESRLTALYPADSDVETYRVAVFHYNGGDSRVEIPQGAVVLNVGGGAVTALVPKAAYMEGGE